MAHCDELIGSVIARFVQRQGLEDDKVALRQLFASQKIVPSSILQGHTNQLLANIGHLWTISPRELLEKHTLLPVFRPFVASEAYSHFVRDLCGKGKNHSMLRTGLNASNIVWPSNFKVCPLCCQQQLRRNGYRYWQRLFQCPGVEACPEHSCLLIDTGVPLQSHRRHRFVGTQGITQHIPAVSPLAARKLCCYLLVFQTCSDAKRQKHPTSINGRDFIETWRASRGCVEGQSCSIRKLLLGFALIGKLTGWRGRVSRLALLKTGWSRCSESIAGHFLICSISFVGFLFATKSPCWVTC